MGCDGGCDSGCSKSCGGGLLKKLFACKKAHHAKMFGGCDSGCCEAPTCGCEAPACGCDSGCDSCCTKSCKIGNGQLLQKLFGNLGCKKSSCCDMGCDSGCGCAAAAPSCGCGSAPMAAPMAAPSYEAAPMPPAPVVDPSASVTQKRRVIQASAVFVR
jgi:hypothetical protein